MGSVGCLRELPVAAAAAEVSLSLAAFLLHWAQVGYAAGLAPAADALASLVALPPPLPVLLVVLVMVVALLLLAVPGVVPGVLWAPTVTAGVTRACCEMNHVRS